MPCQPARVRALYGRPTRLARTTVWVGGAAVQNQGSTDATFSRRGFMIPVYYSHCQILFASRQYNVRNSSGISFSGCSELCANCGSEAQVLDGVYDVTDELTELIRGPQFTIEILKAFRDLLEDAHRSEASFEDVASKARKIHPELGTLLKKAGLDNKWAPTIILIGMLFHSCEHRVEHKIDWNRLVEQVIESDNRTSARSNFDRDTYRAPDVPPPSMPGLPVRKPR